MLLCIVTWITNNAEGSPTGVKINDIKYCGNIIVMIFCLKFLLIKEGLGSKTFYYVFKLKSDETINSNFATLQKSLRFVVRIRSVSFLIMRWRKKQASQTSFSVSKETVTIRQQQQQLDIA